MLDVERRSLKAMRKGRQVRMAESQIFCAHNFFMHADAHIRNIVRKKCLILNTCAHNDSVIHYFPRTTMIFFTIISHKILTNFCCILTK